MSRCTGYDVVTRVVRETIAIAMPSEVAMLQRKKLLLERGCFLPSPRPHKQLVTSRGGRDGAASDMRCHFSVIREVTFYWQGEGPGADVVGVVA